MNFGGIHFIYALLYLALCALITITYAILLYLFYVTLTRSIYGVRYEVAKNKWIAGQGKSPGDLLRKPSHSLVDKIVYKKIVVLVLVFVVTIYFHQRLEWMSRDNKHYNAKEYWVTGQVVYAHRAIFGRVFHPDNPIVAPYTFLLKKIYLTGSKQLPRDDGEKFVWRDAWFIYPYSRTSIRPYFVGVHKYEPAMVELLDMCWETMQGMATKQIADPLMNRKAMLAFPFLLSYYLQFQGHYTGAFWESAKEVRTNKKYVVRDKQMLSWLDGLYVKWIDKNILSDVYEKYPYVAAFRQQAILSLLQDLTLSLVYFNEFDCEHPLMKRMYLEYQNAMSDDPISNSFLNLKRKNVKQATLAYELAVYSAPGAAGNYLLSHVCGMVMPEERYLLTDENKKLNKLYPPHHVEFVFQKELNNLKEGVRK